MRRCRNKKSKRNKKAKMKWFRNVSILKNLKAIALHGGYERCVNISLIITANVNTWKVKKYTFITSFTEVEKFAHADDEEEQEEISDQEDRDNVPLKSIMGCMVSDLIKEI